MTEINFQLFSEDDHALASYLLERATAPADMVLGECAQHLEEVYPDVDSLPENLCPILALISGLAYTAEALRQTEQGAVAYLAGMASECLSHAFQHGHALAVAIFEGANTTLAEGYSRAVGWVIEQAASALEIPDYVPAEWI